MKLMTLLRSLYVQVLLAIVIGVLIGHFAPHWGVELKPLGDGFIRLVKMIITPVIFCTVVLGIAGMDDLRSVGRIGLYALGYFELVTTLALVLGLTVINVLQPGVGLHVDVASLDAGRLSQYTEQAQHQGVVAFLLNIIPTTIFDAFARGDVLQVLLVAVLVGFALQVVGMRAAVLRDAIGGLSHVVFRIVGFIMKLAPLGALGAMAFTIGSQGIAALLPLATLMAMVKM
jgi:aerobic C4-dicarboxylate transport protein